LQIVLASDHAGFKLKEFIKSALEAEGYGVLDVGTFSEESVDYPDYARLGCLEIVNGRAELGILICGTGIGMSIAANKIKGIRAAHCSNIYEAVMARRHNNANVLCLGSRVVGDEHAYAIVKTFLFETFEGGRHTRRIEKIAELEKNTGERS
jgi:ribose 5-phosphate isomerase B